MLSIVMLLSFLMTFRVFGDPPMTQSPSLSGNETIYYSSSEIDCLAELDTLIEDLTAAAVEAIEQAAAEAAKAATIAAVERETVLLRDVQYWRFEADLRQQVIEEARKAGVKNTVLGVVLGILGGLALGIGGTLFIGGR
jgi:hypothetical protein